jgi:hypothetical protein
MANELGDRTYLDLDLRDEIERMRERIRRHMEQLRDDGEEVDDFGAARGSRVDPRPPGNGSEDQ